MQIADLTEVDTSKLDLVVELSLEEFHGCDRPLLSTAAEEADDRATSPTGRDESLDALAAVPALPSPQRILAVANHDPREPLAAMTG
jgi:hypothetical protein